MRSSDVEFKKGAHVPLFTRVFVSSSTSYSPYITNVTFWPPFRFRSSLSNHIRRHSHHGLCRLRRDEGDSQVPFAGYLFQWSKPTKKRDHDGPYKTLPQVSSWPPSKIPHVRNHTNVRRTQYGRSMSRQTGSPLSPCDNKNHRNVTHTFEGVDINRRTEEIILRGGE